MTRCYELEKKCQKTEARTGKIKTAHGEIKTPVFMPVATQGTVKTISNSELRQLGVEIFVANTYHLYLRPGLKVINEVEGLHNFINWDRAILTDSGGYQVYSLGHLRKITKDGVEFRSHIDGSTHFFTPEKVIDLQVELGADIIMCFDECSPYPCSYDYAKTSAELTFEWAKKSKNQFRSNKQLLFGIIQGSTYLELRKEIAKKTVELDFDGYAIGGLAVGEPKETTLEIVENITPLLPQDKPRYAMGVGTPEELWHCVECGIDMFDCVIPSKNGRNGQALTSTGKLNLKNAKHKKDFSPLDSECNCPVCREYSRAYIHHLFNSGELLSLRLLTLHNLFFMLKLTNLIRNAVSGDTFLEEKKKFLEKYAGKD